MSPGSDFDPTLSPFSEEDDVVSAIAQAGAADVPVNNEVKRLIVCINKGVRDAQNGYDKHITEKPQVAMSFQKNMILLLRLQLDALRFNFEMQGGKLSQPTSTTTNQTLVLTNDARLTIADLLSGKGLMGGPERIPTAEPLAGDGG